MRGLESLIISIAIENEAVDEQSRIRAMKGAYYQILTLVRSIKVAKSSRAVSVRIAAEDTINKIEGYINGEYSDEQARKDSIEAFIDELRATMDEEDE